MILETNPKIPSFTNLERKFLNNSRILKKQRSVTFFPCHELVMSFPWYLVGKEDPKPRKNADKPRAGDVLSMVPPKPVGSPHAIEIRVPRNSGPLIFHVDVKPNDTMDDLKTNISQIASYPVKDLFLLDNINVVGRFDNPQNFDFLDVAPLIDVEMPDKTTINVAVRRPENATVLVLEPVDVHMGLPVADKKALKQMKKKTFKSNGCVGKGSCLSLIQAPVSVELPDGEIVDLHLSHCDTIGRAKQCLQKIRSVPVADQYLMLGGEELIDSMRACDYGIDGDATLQLETFTVRVANWDGNMLTFRVFILRAE